MTQVRPFTLIIPAHNEEAVIARCLATATDSMAPGDPMEVIVAANGCTDGTVAIAKASAPSAQVLALPEGSKTGAINAALRIASHAPVIILDADVECNHTSLAALADALHAPGVMTAAPAIRLNLDRCNWFVKAYYRAWAQQPYAKAGKGGAGCYGLSRAAIDQIGEFPPIIGDDIWIHTRFADDTKRMITQTPLGDPVFSIVRPPRTASQQIKVEARRQIGNSEVRQNHPSSFMTSLAGQQGLSVALRSGASPIDLAVFYSMKVLARLQARLDAWRGRGASWTRDLTSRQA
ncbi:glycosyl transferase family 2 [Erythrobacter sp. KY5]|uniref:glycosyltransferase n=1 Tax=Erythrobacter sp. KY5 TaxID=2011159 RepID=UPI000DBF2577|nr:glycosyltransferase family 2 protein [Erythrobacter sp. KY5]AWW72902.1 glycosyl transferase family 2 [Erythrobacter sp. KY5]